MDKKITTGNKTSVRRKPTNPHHIHKGLSKTSEGYT